MRRYFDICHYAYVKRNRYKNISRFRSMHHLGGSYQISSVVFDERQPDLYDIHSYDELMECIINNPKMYISVWAIRSDTYDCLSFVTRRFNEMHVNSKQFKVENMITLMEIK